MIHKRANLKWTRAAKHRLSISLQLLQPLTGNLGVLGKLGWRNFKEFSIGYRCIS